MKHFIVIDIDETNGTVCLFNIDLAYQARHCGIAAPTDPRVAMRLGAAGFVSVNCSVWCKTREKLAVGDKVTGRIIDNPNGMRLRDEFVKCRAYKQ